MSVPDRLGASQPNKRAAIPQAPVPRGPFVMLGLMTLATLLGPLALIVALGGGAASGWPPDRPVEWLALIGIPVLVLGLMLGCVAVAARARRLEVERLAARSARGAGQ